MMTHVSNDDDRAPLPSPPALAPQRHHRRGDPPVRPQWLRRRLDQRRRQRGRRRRHGRLLPLLRQGGAVQRRRPPGVRVDRRGRGRRPGRRRASRSRVARRGDRRRVELDRRRTPRKRLCSTCSYPGRRGRSRHCVKSSRRVHVQRAFGYFAASGRGRPSATRRAIVALTARTLVDLLISVHTMRLADGPLSTEPSDRLRTALHGLAARLVNA